MKERRVWSTYVLTFAAFLWSYAFAHTLPTTNLKIMATALYGATAMSLILDEINLNTYLWKKIVVISYAVFLIFYTTYYVWTDKQNLVINQLLEIGNYTRIILLIILIVYCIFKIIHIKTNIKDKNTKYEFNDWLWENRINNYLLFLLIIEALKI